VLDASPAGAALVVDHVPAVGRQPLERQPAAVPRPAAPAAGGVPGPDRQGLRGRPAPDPAAGADARVDGPDRPRYVPDPAVGGVLQPPVRHDRFPLGSVAGWHERLDLSVARAVRRRRPRPDGPGEGIVVVRPGALAVDSVVLLADGVPG